MAGGLTPADTQSIERAAARSAWFVLPLAVVPIVVLLAAHADVAWLWRGALAWVIAFALKLPLMAALAVLTSKAPAWVHALIAGLVSAGTELGVALLALTRATSTPTLVDIFLFASAAGSVEALALLAWNRLAPTAQAVVTGWLERAATSWIVRHVFVLERTIAWAGHFGSRSLIGLAFVRQVPWLGFVAAATFTLTDAAAAYGDRQKVDWFNPATLIRYGRIIVALVGMELGALLVYLIQ